MDMIIEYCKHEEGENPRMRIRRADWLYDQFILMDYDDFTACKSMCDRLGIRTKNLDI
jgi:hypothetical protein